MYKGRLASFVALAQAVGTWAATVTYNWEVTWVNAAPDGFARPIIGINGQWPCPKIEAQVGDLIVVNLLNSLGNETTGLHFHGIDQINTNFMDGASMVNQCPTPPGSNITYQFVANAPGTFWYHSHNMEQYPDGLRGPLIVHDPNDPFAGQYDHEIILSVSDWYHSQMRPLMQQMLSPSNVQFRPPLPDSMLVNEGQGANIYFDVGKTYRLRIISYAALASAMLQFADHTMEVIQIDSSYVQKQEATMLRVAPAQRYDVLITAKKSDKGLNHPYLFALDVNRDWQVNPVWPHNFTGYLVTDSSLAMDGKLDLKSWDVYNESNFTPYDKEPVLGPVTATWELTFNYCRDVNNYSRACFNNHTYISQKTPTLFSAASLGDNAMNETLYGQVNAFTVKYNDVVELIVNNHDDAIHPFHLHGHQFQVVDGPGRDSGDWPGNDYGINQTPPKRDTVSAMPKSYTVIRFRANNPGVYLFHCHVEFHVAMGLTATLVEAPEKLQGIEIPQDHLDNCNAQNMPTSGNAAGNVDDPLDTTGFNTVPPTDYTGALWLGTGTTRRTFRNSWGPRRVSW